MGVDSYEVVVGCEIHVQLSTRTKAFCSCENRYGGIPNTRVCPVCLGLPGALPRANRELLDRAIAAGLALGCRVASLTKFDRKNYVYPDLPKGYQISQFDMPLCEGGEVEIETDKGPKKVRLIRLHMEEDAGKNLHIDDKRSYVDYNRCGAPLVEIVSEPDLRSADETVAYAQAVREIMRFVGVADCVMEEGGMRCDVNVNLRLREGGKEYATPIAEIKNLNSWKSIRGAVAYEEERQLAEWARDRVTLKEGGKRTLGWDEARGVTVIQRTKEAAADYRYFPEPDLKPLAVPPVYVERVRAGLPELPRAMRERFVAAYGLTDYDARVLTQSRGLASYFEEAAKGAPDPKKIANWILAELLALLKEGGLAIEDFPVRPAGIRELLGLVDSGEISGKIAKDIFPEMVATGKGAAEIAAAKGLRQTRDEGAIAAWVEKAVADNPKALEDFRKGKSNAAAFLVGQVMRLSGGKANPALAGELLAKRLAELAGKAD